MLESEFIAHVLHNRANAEILARMPAMGLADCWLVSGCLFQTVWNVQAGEAPERGIRDYDLFYFDPDTSWDAEDVAIKRCTGAFADLGVEVELRNQARAHLWYEQKFGAPYPALSRSTDGIDRFLMHNAMVGMRPNGHGFDIYAPRGLDDIESMIVRPNVTANFQATRYLEKTKRWQALWPRLTVLSSDDP